MKFKNTKYFLLLLCLGGALRVFSQGGFQDQISADIPKIIPPSPSVASFMKFEEVPVSNYTGIPDISIPIFSSRTHAEEINIDVSLKYHPSSIALDEDASCVGLGWSLFAGGTISRTVRGLPDEYRQQNADYIGIYFNDNPYYDFEEWMNLGTGTENAEEINEFLWYAHEKGKYDTEHDLYQFNFMGHSGRFFITHNNTVQRIDKDNAIDIVYNPAPLGQLTGGTFTLYDDKGFRYDFEVKEMTDQFSSTSGFNGGMGTGLSTSRDMDPVVSSYHLTKIYDPKLNPLVTFDYTAPGAIIEYNEDFTSTYNVPYGDETGGSKAEQLDDQCDNQSSVLLPSLVKTKSLNTTYTRKLQSITIVDYAKVDFIYRDDRDDMFLDNVKSHRLEKVFIKDYRGQLLKEVRLLHDYSILPITQNTNRKRLSLSAVDEIYGNDVLRYALSYRQRPESVKFISKDFWGFPNSSTNYTFGEQDKRETNPSITTIGVLESMQLPAGGTIKYEFEPNTYSYIGNQMQTNYYDNPENWITQLAPAGGGASGSKVLSIPNYPLIQRIRPLGSANAVFSFILYDNAGNALESFGGCSTNVCGAGKIEVGPDQKLVVIWNALGSGGTGNQFGTFPPVGSDPFGTEEGSGSGIFNWQNGNPTWTTGLNYVLQKQRLVPYQFFYGGGVRIKSIAYFNGVDINPIKEKKYSYAQFDNPKLSSGSLVYPKPVFKYGIVQNTAYECGSENGNPTYLVNTINYNVTTSFNNLKAVRTQGSDVGYKNVEVSETGNGYIRYTYDSPIDFPEEVSIDKNFLPSLNKDYQRGSLRREAIYTEDSRILKESLMDYDTVSEGTIQTGYRILGLTNCPYIAINGYETPEDYITRANNCPDGDTATNFCTVCAMPNEYIQYGPVLEAYGWKRLKSKISKDYFYDSDNLRVVQQDESLSYYNYNKKIKTYEKTVYNGSQPEKLKTSYFYTNLNSHNNIGNIEQIVTERDGMVISTQKLVYNGITLKPEIMQASKGTNLVENKIQFVRRDSYGNLQEVKKEDGRSTVYIWGYNKSLPIAMIEGATYNDVIAAASIPISDAITASNDNALTDGILLPKLNAVREALGAYHVTTYTHLPLAGIATVTDVNGKRTSFEYDNQKRLVSVKDNDGNILSENKYFNLGQYNIETLYE